MRRAPDAPTRRPMRRRRRGSRARRRRHDDSRSALVEADDGADRCAGHVEFVDRADDRATREPSQSRSGESSTTGGACARCARMARASAWTDGADRRAARRRGAARASAASRIAATLVVYASDSGVERRERRADRRLSARRRAARDRHALARRLGGRAGAGDDRAQLRVHPSRAESDASTTSPAGRSIRSTAASPPRRRVGSQAVESTRTLVLKYAGRIVNAPYRRRAEARRAAASEMWRSDDEPYLQQRERSDSRHRPLLL